MYLPQAPAPPAYDAYADPAAAHGWQDAYEAADPEAAGDAAHAGGTDDVGATRELPVVPARGRSGAGHRAPA